MGINGRRLTPAEMAKHNYTMTFTDSHIVVELPIGSPDGNYKVGFVPLLLLTQECPTLFLESYRPAEFSSNFYQTHRNHLIKVA